MRIQRDAAGGDPQNQPAHLVGVAGTQNALGLDKAVSGAACREIGHGYRSGFGLAAARKDEHLRSQDGGRRAAGPDHTRNLDTGARNRAEVDEGEINERRAGAIGKVQTVQCRVGKSNPGGQVHRYATGSQLHRQMRDLADAPKRSRFAGHAARHGQGRESGQRERRESSPLGHCSSRCPYRPAARGV